VVKEFGEVGARPPRIELADLQRAAEAVGKHWSGRIGGRERRRKCLPRDLKGNVVVLGFETEVARDPTASGRLSDLGDAYGR
jgi:hypothetical protein